MSCNRIGIVRTARSGCQRPRAAAFGRVCFVARSPGSSAYQGYACVAAAARASHLRACLVAARYEAGAEVLMAIYGDEIGRVTAGTRWLGRACDLDGSEPEPRFLGILDKFRQRRRLRPVPIDREGRRAAGFSARAVCVGFRRPTASILLTGACSL
jgi:hypothetical protein